MAIAMHCNLSHPTSLQSFWDVFTKSALRMRTNCYLQAYDQNSDTNIGIKRSSFPTWYRYRGNRWAFTCIYFWPYFHCAMCMHRNLFFGFITVLTSPLDSVTPIDFYRGLAMRILSVCLCVCQTRALLQNGRKIGRGFYTVRKIISEKKNGWWGRPLQGPSTWNFGSTGHPVGAKSPIFNLYSPVAPQP